MGLGLTTSPPWDSRDTIMSPDLAAVEEPACPSYGKFPGVAFGVARAPPDSGGAAKDMVHFTAVTRSHHWPYGE